MFNLFYLSGQTFHIDFFNNNINSLNRIRIFAKIKEILRIYSLFCCFEYTKISKDQRLLFK